jgi:3-oxoacyl-[acyl-carrier protein] reductase
MQGKTAIITGGGSGIGRASALAFAGAGYNVVIANRTLAKAQVVADEISAAGGTALPLGIQVEHSAHVQHMIAEAMAHFGRIDVLFNNAGISPSGRITEISEADWDECLNIDLKSIFLASKYALPHMIAGGGGVILNTAGTFGIRAARNKAAYSTAKAGAINLTRSIALDYAREGVRCNVICPGYVETALTAGVPDADRDAFLGQYQPLSGVIQADEVAALALYLASDSARMMTGQLFVIDAGQQAGLYA